MKATPRQKRSPARKIPKDEFLTLLGILAGIALLIIQSAPALSDHFDLSGWGTYSIMGVGFLMLLAIVLALLRYRFTTKQKIGLAVVGTVVFGVALFALYKQAGRSLGVSYYQDGRDRLFEPESKKENYVSAIALFKQELQRNPGNVRARAWLSISQALLYLFFQGTDPQLKAEARENANESIRLDPNSAEAHLAQARYAVLENDDNKVDAELQHIVDLNPTDAMIWLAAAVTRQWRGENTKATDYYARAQKLAPEDARICLNYGHHLYEQGEQKESRLLLEKATRRKPESAYFAVIRAVAEISWTGNVEEARTILNRLPPNVNPDCRVTSARCTLALYERNFDAALDFVRKCPAEKVFSVDAGGLGGLEGLDAKREAEGTILLFKGDPKAKDYLEPERIKYSDAVDLQPTSPEANAALAIFDAWTGRKVDAIKHAEEAIRNIPKKGPRRKGVLLGVAKAYAWAGELERAWGQIDSYWSEFGGKTGMSRHNFRLDPSWAPMHDYPEFRNFVGNAEPR